VCLYGSGYALLDTHEAQPHEPSCIHAASNPIYTYVFTIIYTVAVMHPELLSVGLEPGTADISAKKTVCVHISSDQRKSIGAC
jgi:hypothetical protein